MASFDVRLAAVELVSAAAAAAAALLDMFVVVARAFPAAAVVIIIVYYDVFSSAVASAVTAAALAAAAVRSTAVRAAIEYSAAIRRRCRIMVIPRGSIQRRKYSGARRRKRHAIQAPFSAKLAPITIRGGLPEPVLLLRLVQHTRQYFYGIGSSPFFGRFMHETQETPFGIHWKSCTAAVV